MDQLVEVVTKMDLLVGGEASPSMKTFIQILRVAYEAKHPQLVVGEVSLD